MRMYILLLLGVIVMNAFADVPDEARLAIRNGALGKYTYRVVDDEGNAVSNVQAHVWFKSYGRPQDKADWIVETDTNGMFTVEHRFNEKFSVGFDKEGYYHSHDEINYLAMQQLPVEDGKWQPYGDEHVVVLKRIRHPVRLKHQAGGLAKIPAYDKWLGYDLEMLDWIAPFGGGQNSDVLLRFSEEVVNAQRSFTATMDVCFTNNFHAGFYVCRKDMKSELKSIYEADTNAEYRTEQSFVLSRHGRERKDTGLKDDEYWVFRTRTKVDENGKLISAHYGKLYGHWGFYRGMQTGGVWFNSGPNDFNLEDAETARLSLLKRNQELEHVKRSKSLRE